MYVMVYFLFIETGQKCWLIFWHQSENLKSIYCRSVTPPPPPPPPPTHKKKKQKKTLYSMKHFYKPRCMCFTVIIIVFFASNFMMCDVHVYHPLFHRLVDAYCKNISMIISHSLQGVSFQRNRMISMFASV